MDGERFLTAALLAAMSGSALAQAPYTIQRGDGCPDDMRVANQQEIGRLTPICNRVAPESILRMKRTPNDNATMALYGLNQGCQIKEYQGTTTTSVCVALPPPPPPAPGSPCLAASPRALEKPPRLPLPAGTNVLHQGEVLRNGGMLRSQNRGFFAVQQGDGNFVIYKGWDFANYYGVLWATGKQPVVGEYFATQQDDGNFAVYKDAVPGGNPALAWSSKKTASRGQYYTVLENDGNLCTYKGKGPDDISAAGRLQLWCSAATTAAPWIDGKRVVLASTGPFWGASLFWGPWPEAHPANFPESRPYPQPWIRPGTAQRWVLGTDGTFRLAADQSQCLYVDDESGSVTLGSCKGIPNRKYLGASTGWEYCNADGSIRNRKYPSGCLALGPYAKVNLLNFKRKECNFDAHTGVSWQLQ